MISQLYLDKLQGSQQNLVFSFKKSKFLLKKCQFLSICLVTPSTAVKTEAVLLSQLSQQNPLISPIHPKKAPNCLENVK